MIDERLRYYKASRLPTWLQKSLYSYTVHAFTEQHAIDMGEHFADLDGLDESRWMTSVRQGLSPDLWHVVFREPKV